MTSEPSDRELSLEMIQNWTDFAKETLSEDKWKKFAGQETIKIFNNGRGTSNDVKLVNDDAKLKLFKDCHILLLIQTIYRDETNRTAPMKVLRNIIFMELLHLICFGKNKLFHSLSNGINKLPFVSMGTSRTAPYSYDFICKLEQTAPSSSIYSDENKMEHFIHSV